MVMERLNGYCTREWVLVVYKAEEECMEDIEGGREGGWVEEVVPNLECVCVSGLWTLFFVFE